MILKTGSLSDSPEQPKQIQIPMLHCPDSASVSLNWGLGDLFYFFKFSGHPKGRPGLRTTNMENALTERSFDLPKPGE